MQLTGGDTSANTEWKELKPKRGPQSQRIEREVPLFSVWALPSELRRDEFTVAAAMSLKNAQGRCPLPLHLTAPALATQKHMCPPFYAR